MAGLTIGKLARKAGVGVETLRFYERRRAEAKIADVAAKLRDLERMKTALEDWSRVCRGARDDLRMPDPRRHGGGTMTNGTHEPHARHRGRICCGDEERSMRLVLTGEDEVRLEPGEDAFEIAGGQVPLSPYHLMAGSLASCTVLTVASWAAQVGLDSGEIAASVRWEMAADAPRRIGRIEMVLHWPGLPEERIPAADRAADACPVHATLARAAEISRRVETGGG